MPALRASRPVFYGWYVVAVAFTANLFSTGTGLYVFNAFLLPLCQARGWSRAELNVAPMLGFACGLMGQFAYGTLLGRVGPRRLMALGPVAGSAAFVLMGRVESLGWFYLCYMLLLLANGALGGIVASTAVSNWFEAGRGKALGLATAGISLAGVVLPPAAGALVRAWGLETAFAVIGCGLLAMSPAAWLVVRDSPESQGLVPDGPAPDPAAAAGPAAASQACAAAGPAGRAWLEWTPRRLAASGVFWRLGAAYALTMMGVMGVMFQLGPRFQDEGWGAGAALNLVAATALSGAAGKYLWGLLCDRGRPHRVVALMMAANAAGMALGLAVGSAWGAASFVLVFGFAMGGVMSTYPIITAHLFGRASFPLVFRFLLMFLLLQVAGYLLMGQSHALWGSYDLAYAVFVVLDLAAAALVWTLPPADPGP
jgi:MFS family permease